MSDSKITQLVAIASAAGFKAEWHPTNPPKLIGFGKFIDGKFGYGIPAEDFAAIVATSRQSALEEAAKVCEGEYLHEPQAGTEDIAYDYAVRDCAAAIRSLANPAERPEGEKT